PASHPPLVGGTAAAPSPSPPESPPGEPAGQYPGCSPPFPTCSPPCPTSAAAGPGLSGYILFLSAAGLRKRRLAADPLHTWHSPLPQHTRFALIWQPNGIRVGHLSRKIPLLPVESR